MPLRTTVLLVICLAWHPTALHAQQPSPKQLAARADYYGDPLPEGAIARLGSVRFHHQGGVIAAAFSPDSKTILAAGIEKDGLSLRFWDTATGKELSRFAVKGFDVARLAFAPDGKSIFVGRESAVEQYDRHSGKLLREFTAPEGRYRSSAFDISADGRMLATSSVDRDFNAVVYIREVSTGALRITLNGKRGSVVRCAFSTDGKKVLYGGSLTNSDSENLSSKLQSYICVWDLASGKIQHEIASGDYSGSLAPDGRSATSQGNNGQPRIVDLATGQTTCTINAPRSAMEFTRDSKSIITLPYEGTDPPCLWNATTGKMLLQFKSQHQEKLRLIGISPDGKLLAAMAGGWNQDGSVLLWNVATGEPLKHLGGHEGAVTCVAFAPDGKLLASGSLDSTVRLWDPVASKELAALESHKAGITAIAFSPDGKALASSSKDGSTILWDVINRRALATFDGPEHGAASLAFSLDGKTLIAGGNSAVIQMWELAGLKQTATHRTGSDGSVLAISLDGKLALSANGESRNDLSAEKLQLWRIPAAKSLAAAELRKVEKRGLLDFVPTWSAALSADGRIFAAGHSRATLTIRGTQFVDHTLRVWERATGQELHKMVGAKVGALAFSLDGRLLAAGHANNRGFGAFNSQDSRLTIWDMLTGESIRVCKGHANEVACVAFSADGKLLASGSADHTILLWTDFQPAPLKRNAAAPTAKQLETWWDALKDFKTSACDTMIELVSYPDQTVKWIGEHVKPAPAVDTKHISQLIEELDSSDYKNRQNATAALEEIGELAEPQLREALAGKPTLERRQRVELLLNKLDNFPQAPDQLRNVRALAALEWIGTVGAKELLGTIAKGAPESSLTQLAQAALARMAHAQMGAKKGMR